MPIVAADGRFTSLNYLLLPLLTADRQQSLGYVRLPGFPDLSSMPGTRRGRQIRDESNVRFGTKLTYYFTAAVSTRRRHL
jgi:hypothetical protein